MKNITTTLFFLLVVLRVYSQSSVGLVAHWDMNGTVNDVSGNGHNGHANNLTSAAGIAGIPNTAYYFNGVNSYITVPYDSGLNVTNYTICATLKVMGFYDGYCQVNSVFQRGALCCATATDDQYALFFYDNPFDGDNCSLRDTTKDVFIAEYGSYTLEPISVWQYDPQIVNYTWYKAVATWDGTKWQIFINDTLKTMVTPISGLFAAGTDSISIGMDIFASGVGNPSQFNGIIDDIQFYNRALTDSEIHIYSTDSFYCGTITAQPNPITVDAEGNTSFIVVNNMPTPSYQWQENYGSGFVNLINVPPYSGVTTSTLTITGASTSLNSTNYRCIISNSSCSDTSNVASLTVYDGSGINRTISADMIGVYPNPANNIITVQFPENGSWDVQLINVFGQITLQQKIEGKTLTMDLMALPANIYTLRILRNGSVLYKKVIKN